MLRQSGPIRYPAEFAVADPAGGVSDPLTIAAISPRPKNVVSHAVSADVRAALTVVGARDPAHDGPAIVNLETTNLARADLTGASLADANLQGADLADANLDSSDLSQAHLVYANFTNAEFVNTNLKGADLRNSYGTVMPCRSSRTPILTTDRPAFTWPAISSWQASICSNGRPCPPGRTGRTASATCRPAHRSAAPARRHGPARPPPPPHTGGRSCGPRPPAQPPCAAQNLTARPQHLTDLSHRNLPERHSPNPQADRLEGIRSAQ